MMHLIIALLFSLTNLVAQGRSYGIITGASTFYDDDPPYESQESICPGFKEKCCLDNSDSSAASPNSPKQDPITDAPTQNPQQIPSSPSAYPRPLTTLHMSPSTNPICVCTPFFKCFDKETSSNLTGIVNDRTINIPVCISKQEDCADPNEICCCNETQTLPEPNMNPTYTSLPQPQAPTLTQISPTNNNCVCTPFFESYDEETSSNLTNLVNDRSLIPGCEAKQENCTNPNDVCCCNLTKPLATSNINPTNQAQPQGLSQLSPSIGDCICRPSSDCHDKEIRTGSSGLVSDISGDNPQKVSCEDPNEVCCFDLVESFREIQFPTTG